MPVCEIDLRPGGKYRYVYESTGGRTFQMSGEYTTGMMEGWAKSYDRLEKFLQDE